MQAYGGNMGEAKVSVTLATLPPGKKPSTHWMEVWMDPRDSLDVLEERKIPLSNRALDAGPSGA